MWNATMSWEHGVKLLPKDRRVMTGHKSSPSLSLWFFCSEADRWSNHYLFWKYLLSDCSLLNVDFYFPFTVLRYGRFLDCWLGAAFYFKSEIPDLWYRGAVRQMLQKIYVHLYIFIGGKGKRQPVSIETDYKTLQRCLFWMDITHDIKARVYFWDLPDDWSKRFQNL